MKLFASPASPYARKVRVLLEEKKIPYEYFGEHSVSPDHPVHEHNPLGKVPALVLDDGQALYDSAVIVEYLDEQFPTPKFIPGPLEQRIHIRKYEALADGVCDAAVLMMLERRRPPERQSDEWVAHQRKKVEHGIEALAKALGKQDWLVANTLTLADVAAACVLGYVTLRMPEYDWGVRYPGLAQLAARMAGRESFKTSKPG
jgi:glutathione S-transferase